MKKYLGILFMASFMLVFAYAQAKNEERVLEREDDSFHLEDEKSHDIRENEEDSRDDKGKFKLPPLLNEDSKNLRSGIKEDREKLKAEIKSEREVLKSTVDAMKDKREELKGEFKENLETLKAKREELKEQFKENRDTLKAELKTKLEAFKAEVKAKKEEFKNQSQELKEKFRQNAQNIIGERFLTAVTNIEKAQSKVGDLISKLEGESKDTGDAKTYLEDSKAKLADAKSKLDQVKNLLPASGVEVSAEDFEKIKIGAREAKDILKESHQALMQAVQELRSLRGEGAEAETEPAESQAN